MGPTQFKIGAGVCPRPLTSGGPSRVIGPHALSVAYNAWLVVYNTNYKTILWPCSSGVLAIFPFGGYTQNTGRKHETRPSLRSD